MNQTRFQRVVQEYRKQQKMSLRDFARAIGMSHTAIAYWERGERVPNPTDFISLALTHADWRRDFAIDCMAALHPEMYKPATTIGSPA